MINVISVKNLTKNYGALEAVKGINFTVKKGEIFGLLGPNGAGKTTTLEIIESLQKPTSGNINVLGIDPVKNPMEVKKKIGIQLQASSYYEFLKLHEIIDLFASFYNKQADADRLLEMVGLEQKRNAFVTQLSGGQKQRFSIIAALVNDPKIIFLDEPTTGLDPQARRNLWDVIKKIRSQGTTVILTTHYMEEAQVLCDRIAIMDNGKIIAEGTSAQLINKLDYQFKIIYQGKECLAKSAIAKLQNIVSQKHDYNEQTKIFTCMFGVKKVQEILPKIIAVLQRKKLPFEDLEVIPSNLEDVFIVLTGKQLRD